MFVALRTIVLLRKSGQSPFAYPPYSIDKEGRFAGSGVSHDPTSQHGAEGASFTRNIAPDEQDAHWNHDTTPINGAGALLFYLSSLRHVFFSSE